MSDWAGTYGTSESIKAGLDRLTQKRFNARLQETEAVKQILGAPQND